ncbi:MAG TPA: VWA domain-containing protein [Thermoanaerobaculia bacterium]|nr:VWA domain-containing protein [Thermoanaerobaculia bacterium]
MEASAMPEVTRRTAAVFALCLISLSSVAQPAPLTTGETIEVSLVNVDVFVTDRDGNRVRGLTAADFEIREGGRLQPITNFTEYAPLDARTGYARETGEAAAASAPAASTTPAAAKRAIVVFIESVTLAPFRAKPIFDSIRAMLRRTVRPGDAVAVVSWLNASLVRQDFTDDLDLIERALDDIEEENTGPEGNYADQMRRRGEFAQAFQRELVAAGYPTSEAELTTSSALSVAQAELFEIRQKSFALRAYMEAIAGFEGKKILIMATKRFGEYAGSEYFGGDVPFRHRSDLETRPYREAVIDTANANNITIYPIYPRGLGNSILAGADESGRAMGLIDRDADLRRFSADNYKLLNETTSLHEIAHRTGGVLAWGSKDIAQLMPRIADDLDSYYSLAYRATSSGRDEARSIRVTARNGDYVVRARREYVEKSDETRMSDLVVANLVRVSPGGTLPIRVEVGDITRDGRRRSVPLRIRIPVDALTTIEGGGTFAVYLASGGAFGVISEVDRRTQRYTLEHVRLATADDDAFTYDVTLKIERGAYRLSIGILDEVSKEYGLAHVELPLEDGE